MILLWSFVIISPLLFMDNTDQEWMAVHVMWVECAVVGFASLVNRFILMPQLFFQKRYANYIISLSVLFLFMGLFVIYFDGVNKILSLFYDSPIEHTLPHMPRNGDGGGAMPPHRGHTPMASPHSNMPTPPTKAVIPPNITTLMLMVIVIALDMGMSIASKWIISERKQAEIKRERVAVQLSNLQSQVSPHFFMNTLNNIHALVDIDSKRAKQTIIELSNLMDYLLYDSSNKERVSLLRELEFTENYINLMRLRYPKRVLIDFSYKKEIPKINIPPLLFLNFIENAFKYGVDYSQESFIKIDFFVTEQHIEMTVINSNHSTTVKSKRHGLGISNSRKRLKLLYADRFSLDINDTKSIYSVTLKIPIEIV